MKVTCLLLIECSLLLRGLYAVGNLTSVPEVINGTVSACPGDTIALTCAHNNDGQMGGIITRWEVSGANPCTDALIHEPSSVGTMCGPFTYTVVNQAVGPATLISTAEATATADLNGITVLCRAGSTMNSPVVGNITINVLDIPTPTISLVEQVSEFEVRVSMSVSDSQCVARYRVNSTQTDTGTSSLLTLNTSSLIVSDLDVCMYNYSFEALVLSPGGIVGDPSPPYSFSADLSVVNSTTLVVNEMDPLIEWMQRDSLYPNCISNFMVTSGLLSTTVDSTTRSLTAQQLNDAGFPYCTTINVTVTPITPMGPLETVSGNMPISLIDPNFSTPSLTGNFILNSAVVVLQVSVQNVSDAMVPIRGYQFTSDGVTSNMTIFAGDSFDIELPGVDEGQEVSVTVMFENGPCQNMSNASYTVPSRNIDVVNKVTDTSATVTITLPLTEYQPEQLLIISSIEPQDDGPIITNFTTPGAQTTVIFTGLTPSTGYNSTTRIVLRSNSNISVVNDSIGMFMTMMMPTTPTTPPTTAGPTTGPPTVPQTTQLSTPAPSPCGIGCIVAIIVVIVVLIALVIIIIVVVLVVRSKKSCSMKVTSKEVEMEQKLTAPNDNGGDSKPEPTSDTYKNDEARQNPTSTSGAEGTTTSAPETLIYADLDLAKGKKPTQPQVSTTSGGAAKEEEVQYATIDTAKTTKPDTKQPPGQQSES